MEKKEKGGEQRMKKTKLISAILVSIMTAFVLATSIQMALATELIPVTFTVPKGSLLDSFVHRVADGAIRLRYEKINCYASGDITSLGGTAEINSERINMDEPGAYQMWVEHGIFYLTDVTFQDQTGDLTLKLEGKWTGSQYPGEGAGYRWIILSGTDGLESLHGVGTFDSASKLWMGTVHFSP